MSARNPSPSSVTPRIRKPRRVVLVSYHSGELPGEPTEWATACSPGQVRAVLGRVAPEHASPRSPEKVYRSTQARAALGRVAPEHASPRSPGKGCTGARKPAQPWEGLHRSTQVRAALGRVAPEHASPRSGRQKAL